MEGTLLKKGGTSAAAVSAMISQGGANKIFDDFEIPFERRKDRGPSIIGLIDSDDNYTKNHHP